LLTAIAPIPFSGSASHNKKGAGYPAPFLQHCVRDDYFLWQSLHLVGPFMVLWHALQTL
jgi:hypothetical protein